MSMHSLGPAVGTNTSGKEVKKDQENFYGSAFDMLMGPNKKLKI